MTTLRITKKDLSDVAKKLTKLVTSDNTRPINQTVLIEALDQSAWITGSDGMSKLSMRVSLDEPVPEYTATLAHGELFCQVISKMTDEKISLVIGPTHLAIKGDKSNYEVGVFDHREYPFDSSIEETVWETEVFPKKEIFTAFSKIDFCVSPKDLTKAVAGALIHFVKDECRVVAANRNMMAMYSIPFSLGKDMKATVSNSFCRHVPLVTNDEGSLSVKITKSEVVMADGNFKLSGRQLVREFLPYEKVLLSPKYFVTVKKKEFLAALRRARLFESKATRSQSFFFDSNELKITFSQPESSSAGEEVLSCYNEGDPIRLRFSANDLIGVVKVLEEETITIGVIGENAPIRIDEGRFTFVIQCVLGG